MTSRARAIERAGWATSLIESTERWQTRATMST